jgi:hypothetical protein
LCLFADVLCCNLTVQDETEWLLSAGKRDRRLFKTSSSCSALYKSGGATSAHSGGSSSSRGAPVYSEVTAEIQNVEEIGERTREPELDRQDSSNANLAGDHEDSLLSTIGTQAFLIKNKLSCVDKLGLDLMSLQEMSDDELHEAGLSVLDQTRYQY